MPITVEFFPQDMYAKDQAKRYEVVLLAQEDFQKMILGKDDKIYDKAIIT